MSYKMLISEKRNYPKSVRMQINIEVVIPYGTPEHEQRKKQLTNNQANKMI